ncbi:MAG: cation transporter [Spirochaetota bacterium]|nr:cation transporter [Spirochaetota bacterium]
MNMERIGISVSILGAIIMAIFGLTMAYLTKSDAILLDGMFNLLSAFLSVGSLIISMFVTKGYTKHHPMGFYAYESFMIFIKGLFILGLVVMSLHSNITVLLSGGRDPNIVGMITYAIPALLINLLTLVACYLTHKKAKTELLYAEFSAWKLNALITGVIVIALVIVFFLKNTSFGWIDRYIDQVLVIVLCILTITDPINLIKNSFKELMLRAVNNTFTEDINLLIKQQFKSDSFNLEDISVSKLGRGTWISIDLSVLDKTLSLEEYINFQNSIKKIFSQKYSNIEVFFNFI